MREHCDALLLTLPLLKAPAGKFTQKVFRIAQEVLTTAAK
jgi:hypothetical protein